MKKKEKSNKLPMKKRVVQTAKHTGIGLVGVAGGTGAAAGLGKFSPILGLILLGAGYFLGGKWQVLSVAGAATLGYGIAKSQDNRNEQTVKDRLVTFKNDWLHAFFIDKLTKKSDTSDETIGAIDLSELDDLERKIEESAIKYQMRQMENEALADSFEAEEIESNDLEDADFTVIEEEIDFANF